MDFENSSISPIEEESDKTANYKLAEFAKILQHDSNLLEEIEIICNSDCEINHAKSEILILIKNYLNNKKERFNIDDNFIKTLQEDADNELDKLFNVLDKNPKKLNQLQNRSLKDLKRAIKNFAIYEVYKVMNPRRIAGEREVDNYKHNLVYGDVERAEKYSKDPDNNKNVDIQEIQSAKAKIKAYRKNHKNIGR